MCYYLELSANYFLRLKVNALVMEKATKPVKGVV